MNDARTERTGRQNLASSNTQGRKVRDQFVTTKLCSVDEQCYARKLKSLTLKLESGSCRQNPPVEHGKSTLEPAAENESERSC
jgi:hypothetical protein